MRNLTLMLLGFILLLSACTGNTNEDVSSQEETKNKITELEKKIEEQSKKIEEQKETIEEFKSKQTNEKAETVSQNVDDTNDTSPTLKIGETYSDDKIEVTVFRIENTTTVNKGIQVFFEVKNKSKTPLQTPGTFKFSLKDKQFEEELNRLGYTINFEPHGYIYQGEERNGNYHYLFERDVEITEATFYINENGFANQPIATWKVK
ncbi:hypothetical protein [Virgibacillus halodenitrificans]|uniref:DUF4352 domain-containing protein n=1 Tax=Virgibacillus halodenitrificans TaxID=1482 RepID=A0ABR7VLG9_VIRHA|nr:hypothetical protein [Virgibacillus halodenitrificans]MBD1222765.1 hypothetical protein [Virgibacillus halodenitrificans]